MKITIQTKQVEALISRGGDLGPALDVIGSDLQLIVDDAFETQKSPDGQAWDGLDDDTVRIKPRRNGGRALIDTGRLRNSITVTRSDNGVAVGTNVEYAAMQQFGGRSQIFGRGVVRIPSRRFLPVDAKGTPLLSDSFIEHCAETVAAYLRGKVDGIAINIEGQFERTERDTE